MAPLAPTTVLRRFWRSPWRDIAQFVLLIVVVVWLVTLSSARLGYNWQWYRIPRYFWTVRNGRPVVGELLQGLGYTLQLSAVSLVCALTLGLVVALLRLSSSFMGRALSRVYLEITRNTPLVVQIYLAYFVLGPVLGIGRFSSAVLALTLFEGSYMSEIFRAGITSLHRGQWEAAYSLGLSTLDSYRFVILPQAVRRLLPPLTSEVVSLIKNTSLVSLVSLADLSMQARVIAADTFLTFEVWFTVALIYLLIMVPLAITARWLERRYAIAT
ncbi:MAG: amino acid ABC transporter permease [Anaerolineae bacterium]|jgi:polar amino acid transport system permease protein|nr:amino acid ABC transporter permease [Chloroflexota bacterium]